MIALVTTASDAVIAGDSLQVVEFRQYNVHFTGEIIAIDTIHTPYFWVNIQTGVYSFEKNGFAQHRYREHGWEGNQIGWLKQK
jgi:hypothetical protein